MEKFLQALKEGKQYDFISNNGWELSKEELIRIIKEYDFAIYEMRVLDDKEDIYNRVYDNILEVIEEEK